MKALLAVLVVIFTFFSFCECYCTNCSAKEFEINLDLPPEERWNNVIEAMKDSKYLFEILAEILPSYFDDWWDEYVKDNLVKIFGNDVQQELLAWSKKLDIDLKLVVKVQFFYAFSHYCSFIVTKDHTGVPVLGHNFDAGFQSIAGNLILQYKFTRETKVVGYTSTFWGFLGAFSAMKVSNHDDGFAITLDGRKTANGTADLNYSHLKRGGVLAEFLMRDLVTAPGATYRHAESVLENRHLTAPYYLGLVGTSNNEIAYFVRDYQSSSTYHLAPPSTWYLAATNSDPGVHCPRMDKINEIMTNEVRNWSGVNETSIMRIFGVEPVYIPDSTDFQNWMVPSTGIYRTNLPWEDPK